MHIVVIPLAFAFDLLFGEVSNRFHPVAFMGRFIGAGFRRKPRGNGRRFVYGILLVLSGLLIFAAGAFFLEKVFLFLPSGAGLFLTALLLKQTFAVRSLLSAGRRIEEALIRDDLPEARRLLSFHLVSRDTSELSSSEIAGAAVESLAENVTDGVTSPLLYFAVLGLPGAWGYRYVNTCDSMIAYRDPEREYVGKFAAYFDTALNYLPARITAVLIAAAAALCREDWRNALGVAFSQHRRTPSRNAGWTMAAMAGALGVILDKRDCYRLEGGSALPDAETLRRAGRIAAVAVALSAGFAAAAFVLLGGFHVFRS